MDNLLLIVSIVLAAAVFFLLIKKTQSERNDKNDGYGELLRDKTETIDKLLKEKDILLKKLELLEKDWKTEFDALKTIRTLLTQGVTKAGELGESILKTILESAGLKETKDGKGVGQFYVNKVAGQDPEGRAQRPDIVLLMPEKRKIVIDSKVSLIDYSEYCKAQDEDIKKQARQRHIASVKKHIDDLAKKKYSDLFGDYSLEFTVLFMASEGAYIEVLSDLANYSYEKKIAIVGPTTLMPIIKIVQSYWKLKEQNENVANIYKKAGDLIDVAADLITEYDIMSDALSKATTAVHKSGKRLKDLSSNAKSLSTISGGHDLKSSKISGKERTLEVVQPDIEEK